MWMTVFWVVSAIMAQVALWCMVDELRSVREELHYLREELPDAAPWT